jgi:hypothetical protein
MINGEALRSFGGPCAANFRTRYQTVSDVIPAEPRVGVGIIRGNFTGNFIPPVSQLGVLPYYGFTTIILENLIITNQYASEQRTRDLFDRIWTQIFGKESDRPKLIFHLSEEIDKLVEVRNTTN